jgi:hypothetical protein
VLRIYEPAAFRANLSLSRSLAVTLPCMDANQPDAPSVLGGPEGNVKITHCRGRTRNRKPPTVMYRNAGRVSVVELRGSTALSVYVAMVMFLQLGCAHESKNAGFLGSGNLPRYYSLQHLSPNHRSSAHFI